MNTQKKSLFALAMTMTLSIAVIQGISKSHVVAKDRNLQQVSAGAFYLATRAESREAQAVYATIGSIAGSVSGNAISAAIPTAVTPFGWASAGLALVTGL